MKKGVVVQGAFRALASVQLAVALIAVYAVVLVWGTRIESLYGAAAAHFGVYKAWWFTALNVLLAVNVLGAVLIRFPWRRRQTGFLVTHAGVLVLLAGCLATQRAGVEAQLSVDEGHASRTAYEDSCHFELQADGDTIRVPFVSGPISWSRYRAMSWFPWRLARRSQGVVFNRDGIALEVLDYTNEPQPTAQVRLTVDGEPQEFNLTASSGESAQGSQRHVVEGRRRRVTITLPQDTVDLAFQVYLRQFRRRLDPGTGMPSHYSSRVDFLELSDPPKKLPGEKKLREDVLITLNRPVDFADPRSGRTYRLFQSSFEGPWLPGDPKFDELVGSDRSRDHVYKSVLSVNYDPGRGLKYAGCLMIVVGIAVVYYLRGFGKSSPGLMVHGSGIGDRWSGVCQRPPTAVGGGEAARRGLCSLVVLLSVGGACRAADRNELDWSTWQRLPTFAQGRVTPLDTFARENVEAICGRAEPTIEFERGHWRHFSAAELLFRWLVEPEKWETTAFLAAEDAQLRQDVLGLPLRDAGGRRLRYASPVEVENSAELGRRLAEIQQKEGAEGKGLRLTGVDKSIKNLVDAYDKYRQLTFNPKSPKQQSWRFLARARSAGDALGKLAGGLLAADRIGRDPEIRQRMLDARDALEKLIGQVHGGELSLEKVEPAAAAFGRTGERLAARLTDADDKPLGALAADLRRQCDEMHLALYDNGQCLRLVPALDAGALEENRTPEDDASPWLGFQAMILGSNDLLRAYPQPELQAVRKAFAEVKSAPHETFSAAMDRFAASLRALAEKTEPLRAKLPIQHRDQELIDSTAYPPPGSTDAEVFYNRLDPFFWSWVVSLAATICLLLAVGRWQKPMFLLGVAVLVAAQGFTAAGLGLRWYITGLVPLTGMFETVVFVALYAAMLGLWFTLKPLVRLCVPLLGTRSAAEPTNHEHCLFQAVAHDVFQRRLFAVAGAIVSFIAAVLAYYAPATVMHRHIGAATPILRDNFWLAVHVVTIMASYASAAIALILGNMALGYYLFGRYSIPHTPCAESGTRRVPPTMCSVLAGFIYTAIQITVLLLAAGTVLGALWADEAWGRFWGWDPKEVWALVSLLVYLLLLHARHVGWSSAFGMAVTAVLGFTAILFTWYGVNFLMDSGMHSYGSGAGGKWAVVAALVVQWLFVLAAAVRKFLESEEALASES